MQIVYDTASRTFSIDTSAPRPFGDSIEARIDRHGRVVPFSGLSFGISIARNGGEPVKKSFPASGVVYRETDQDILTAWRAEWLPGETVEVFVWLENGGSRVEGSAVFVAPYPLKPFESWVWSGASWAAPVPYPDDGGDHEWHEASLSWVSEGA